MDITYLSSPSNACQVNSHPGPMCDNPATPKCSNRCDFLKMILCLWEKNLGGLGGNAELALCKDTKYKFKKMHRLVKSRIAEQCTIGESSINAADCFEARGAEGNITVKLSSRQGNQH